MDLGSLKNMDLNDLMGKLKSGGLGDKKILIKFGIGFVAVLVFLYLYLFGKKTSRLILNIFQLPHQQYP